MHVIIRSTSMQLAVHYSWSCIASFSFARAGKLAGLTSNIVFIIFSHLVNLILSSSCIHPCVEHDTKLQSKIQHDMNIKCGCP